MSTIKNINKKTVKKNVKIDLSDSDNDEKHVSDSERVLCDFAFTPEYSGVKKYIRI